jgi:uncharacterized membrane protein
MDIFGKVNQGIHSYRLFDLAIVDVIMTILGAYVISYVFRVSFLYTLCIVFIIGIILHRYFNVRTTIDKMLF